MWSPSYNADHTLGNSDRIKLKFQQKHPMNCPCLTTIESVIINTLSTRLPKETAALRTYLQEIKSARAGKRKAEEHIDYLESRKRRP